MVRFSKNKVVDFKKIWFGGIIGVREGALAAGLRHGIGLRTSRRSPSWDAQVSMGWVRQVERKLELLPLRIILTISLRPHSFIC